MISIVRRRPDAPRITERKQCRHIIQAKLPIIPIQDRASLSAPHDFSSPALKKFEIWFDFWKFITVEDRMGDHLSEPSFLMGFYLDFSWWFYVKDIDGTKFHMTYMEYGSESSMTVCYDNNAETLLALVRLSL